MIDKLIKSFIPEDYQVNEEEKRRAKLTIASMLIVNLFSVNYTVISYLLDYKGGLYSQVPMFFVSLCCLFLYKNKVRVALVNILFFSSSIISIAITVYFTKGYESFILSWFAALPVVTLLLTGKRGGLIMLLCCLIMLTAFYVLHIKGCVVVEEYNLEYKNLFSFSTHIGLLLILYVVAMVFENTKNAALRNLNKKNKQLAIEKKRVEAKQKEILDSINYAKKIQESILPSDFHLRQLFADSFVLYKPKDIVSGDFYWVSQWGNKTLFAAVDCTGHGVPGALMSIVGQNILNQTVNEYGITKPGLILDALNRGVAKTFSGTGGGGEIHDGMDIACCCIDTKEMLLEFAGAYNSTWIYRDGNILEIKGDKVPIGAALNLESSNYANHEFQIKKGDIIYVFTDGYADQFGGVNDKKFNKKRIKELILNIANQPLDAQKAMLDKVFEEWRMQAGEEQVDDVLFIGVKV